MATSNFSLSWEHIILKAPISVADILIMLPLSIFILYLGFQRWRKGSSSTMSHSDFFTYNLAVMELIGVGGFAATLYELFRRFDYPISFIVGSFPWYGQMIFPVFTCIEHYMAAVHPVTYLSLKQGKGLQIRYVSTGAVWLLSIAVLILLFIYEDWIPAILILDTSQMIVYLITMFYCSVSVLNVLIHPKPGDQTKDKVRVGKKKRQAFLVIVMNMMVLFFRFGWNVTFVVICFLIQLGHNHQCNILDMASYCLNMFSSLMLPLLYLHRAGKLPQCRVQVRVRS